MPDQLFLLVSLFTGETDDLKIKWQALGQVREYMQVDTVRVSHQRIRTGSQNSAFTIPSPLITPQKRRPLCTEMRSVTPFVDKLSMDRMDDSDVFITAFVMATGSENRPLRRR